MPIPTIVTNNDGAKENAIIVDWDRCKYVGCIFEDGTYRSVRRYTTDIKVSNRLHSLPMYFFDKHRQTQKEIAQDLKLLRAYHKVRYSISHKSETYWFRSMKKMFSFARRLKGESYHASVDFHDASGNGYFPLFSANPWILYRHLIDTPVSAKTVRREISKLNPEW